MILADENINSSIIEALRSIPVDVISIAEDYSGMSDEDIIGVSKDTNLIILTEDKDFGEWVFAHKVTGISVVLLRYSFDETDQITLIILSLLKEKQLELLNKFTVVTVNKIRFRKI